MVYIGMIVRTVSHSPLRSCYTTVGASRLTGAVRVPLASYFLNAHPTGTEMTPCTLYFILHTIYGIRYTLYTGVRPALR